MSVKGSVSTPPQAFSVEKMEVESLVTSTTKAATSTCTIQICFPYWPKANKKNTQYGGYAVSACEFNEQDGYTQRIFTITGPQVLLFTMRYCMHICKY